MRPPTPAARSLGKLTPVEFELLLSLARAKGRVKTRDHLLEEVDVLVSSLPDDLWSEVLGFLARRGLDLIPWRSLQKTVRAGG